jgi:hypothetical protein
MPFILTRTLLCEGMCTICLPLALLGKINTLLPYAILCAQCGTWEAQKVGVRLRVGASHRELGRSTSLRVEGRFTWADNSQELSCCNQ